MDENKILEGYNLLREKQILESEISALGTNEMSNAQILVPERVYDKLIKMFSDEIEIINKEIAEL